VPGESMSLHVNDMAQTPGVRVVNMSLGDNSFVPYTKGENVEGCADSAQQQTIDTDVNDTSGLYRRILAGPGANIVWTFAAGNNCLPEAGSGMGANSDLPNVLTVAATNSDGTLASFSNYGTNVSVAAPGGVEPTQPAIDLDASCTDPTVQDNGKCGLLSTMFTNCGGFCDAYGEMAGTSMAAPIVAGVAALAISENSALSADQVGNCIKLAAGTDGVGSTAAPDGQPGGTFADPPIPYAGPSTPIVNAAAAVTCAADGGIQQVDVSPVGNVDGPIGYGPAFTGPACGSDSDTGLLLVYADGNLRFSYSVSGGDFATSGWTQPLQETDYLAAGTHQMTFVCLIDNGSSKVTQWAAAGFQITLTGTASDTEAASSAPQGGSLSVSSGVAGDPCPTVAAEAPGYAFYQLRDATGNYYDNAGGTSDPLGSELRGATAERPYQWGYVFSAGRV
jgi:hypothetical protein